MKRIPSLLPKKALAAAHVAFTITAAMLLFGSAAQAQLLIDPTVSAYSSQNPYGINRAAVHTVDGHGLTAGPSGILGEADSTHTYVSDGNNWTTAGNTGATPDIDPYITYDLGAVSDLQTTRIWNYNENGGVGFGPSSIRLSTSVDGTNFSVLTTLNPVEAGGGPAEIAQDFATAASGIRYVQMQILTTYGGAIYWSSITGTNAVDGDGRILTGLSEVRFVVAGAVPQTPVVTTQPVGWTNWAGNTAIFTVAATDAGFPPLTYRWQKNGTNLIDGGNISGAATTDLTVANVTGADTGKYSVIVSNAVDHVSSAPAYLAVVLPPGLSLRSRNGGTLITPSISAFSSEYNTPPYQRLVTNLVNGAGMSGPGYYTDTHDNGPDDVWHHASGDDLPFVTFDLGGNKNLLITRIWNLNQPGFSIGGAKDVRISVSADSTNYTVLGTNTLNQAGNTPAEPAQDFSTPASAIRYVKLEPLNGYGAGWNGLSAVRFVVAGPQQPVLLDAVLQGIPGLHYLIESVDVLGDPNAWEVLDNIPVLAVSPYHLPVLDGAAPTNQPQRFYRAVILWP